MREEIANIDPQQEIFSRVKIDVEAQGKAVYDGFLPPEDTPYPFVYMGECRQSDQSTKGATIGRVYQTIHLWHDNPHKRGTVSAMLAEIKAACRAIKRTDHFAWRVVKIESNIIPDTSTASTNTSTKTPLLHGYVYIEWAFS